MADRRRQWRSLATLALVGAALPATTGAQDAAPDSAGRNSPPSRGPWLERRDLYVLAGLAATTVALLPHDRQLTLQLRHPRRQASTGWRSAMRTADVYGTPIAYATGPLLLAVGSVAGSERAVDVGAHITEAYALATVTSLVVKGIAGRGRPYWPTWDSASDFRLGRGFPRREQYSSFPSGHSAGAFAFATAISTEAAHWWPRHARLVSVVAYGAAAADGVSRVYRDTHWPSDVAAGALVGTVSGLLVARRAHPTQPRHADGGPRLPGQLLVQPDPAAGGWRVGWTAAF